MTDSTLTAVERVKVGHAQDERARTGCTVILFDPEADVACDARGGWPGTYDTHSIDIGKTYVKKHAVFLTGGDVFGFDSAIGVRRFLLEQKLAMQTGAGKVPGIVGANIWDLEFAANPSLQVLNAPSALDCELRRAACHCTALTATTDLLNELGSSRCICC